MPLLSFLCLFAIVFLLSDFSKPMTWQETVLVAVSISAFALVAAVGSRRD